MSVTFKPELEGLEVRSLPSASAAPLALHRPAVVSFEHTPAIAISTGLALQGTAKSASSLGAAAASSQNQAALDHTLQQVAGSATPHAAAATAISNGANAVKWLSIGRDNALKCYQATHNNNAYSAYYYGWYAAAWASYANTHAYNAQSWYNAYYYAYNARCYMNQAAPQIGTSLAYEAYGDLSTGEYFANQAWQHPGS